MIWWQSVTHKTFLAKVLPLDQKYVSVAESQKQLEKMQILSNILWVTCLLGHPVVDLDFGGPFGWGFSTFYWGKNFIEGTSWMGSNEVGHIRLITFLRCHKPPGSFSTMRERKRGWYVISSLWTHLRGHNSYSAIVLFKSVTQSVTYRSAWDGLEPYDHLHWSQTKNDSCLYLLGYAVPTPPNWKFRHAKTSTTKEIQTPAL